jgi:hypothetical protein
MTAGPAAEVSAATTGMAAPAAVLGKGSRPGPQAQHSHTGKYERRTKRSRSFHDITQ